MNTAVQMPCSYTARKTGKCSIKYCKKTSSEQQTRTCIFVKTNATKSTWIQHFRDLVRILPKVSQANFDVIHVVRTAYFPMKWKSRKCSIRCYNKTSSEQPLNTCNLMIKKHYFSDHFKSSINFRLYFTSKLQRGDCCSDATILYREKDRKMLYQIL